jgi:hypothetical protein
MNRQLIRPPSVPLFACDPYFSVWANGDSLHDSQTRHWTGAEHPIVVLVRIDGVVHRLVGARPGSAPALPQKSLRVLPMQTIVEHEWHGVAIRLTWWSPAFPDDSDAVSRSVAFLDVAVTSVDEATHDVQLLVEAWPELATNVGTQQVVWHRPRVPGVTALSLGTADQNVLGAVGDDVRIDWGHLYLAGDAESVASDSLVPHQAAHASFESDDRLPQADATEMPVEPNQWRDVATLDLAFDFGRVGSESVTRTAILAYDEGFAVEFQHRRLRPYWRRDKATAADLLKDSLARQSEWHRRAIAFDNDLMEELESAGGPEYAQLAALCFRQTLGAQKLVADIDGRPLVFSKENFSNGCMGTVDVAYPTCPFFLCFAPMLLKATLDPIFTYAAGSRWRFDFAPHDLGRYPLANGQVYGGGERSEAGQMPVEECGNMLLMTAALARIGGDVELAERYWPQLRQWAGYLERFGFDPADQLCTDDFAGRLAHNVNLSIKTAVALGSYSQLAAALDKDEEAQRYRETASRFAAEGLAAARRDGGGTRLAFDQPESWSQKYNLIWDQLLGLGLYPPHFAQQEVAFYRTRLDEFGLPLDSRSAVGKLDWHVWSATLADRRDDFDTLMRPLYRWVTSTTDRVPLSDNPWTDRPQKRNMQARGVVGGVFIRLLKTRLGQPLL